MAHPALTLEMTNIQRGCWWPKVKDFYYRNIVSKIFQLLYITTLDHPSCTNTVHRSLVTNLPSSTINLDWHLVIESLDHLGWKRPLISPSPTINLTLPSPPLNHIPKCHTYMSSEYARVSLFPCEGHPRVLLFPWLETFI